MPIIRALKNLLRKVMPSNGPEADAPIKSLVWLLKEPRIVNQETVLILARKVLGDELVTVAELPKQPNLPGDMYMVVAKPRTGFGVIVSNCPYVEDIDAEAAEISELRRRQLFSQHTAWMAVDLMGDDNSSTSWTVAGKLVAEFSGPDCLLLYAPSTGRMEPFSDELLEVLRGPDPLSAIGFDSNPPVIGFESEPEGLQQARDEAKSRWQEFVSAFEAKNPSHENFAVKAPFDTADGEAEFMWVMVEELDGEIIRGSLGNDPVNIPSLKYGSPVEVKRDEIHDWVYIEDGEMIGGFSTKVLMQK